MAGSRITLWTVWGHTGWWIAWGVWATGADLPLHRGPDEALHEFIQRPEVQEELDRLTLGRRTFNKVELLHLGYRSKKARYQLIDEAEKYVHIGTYLWFL